MSKSTRRSITSTRSRGWISQLMEATLLEKSLISLSAHKWYPSHTSIRKRKSLSGRLQAMMKRMKYFLTGIYSRLGVSSRWRRKMSRRIDYLSEDMYNIWKGDLMPNKKKKTKKKNLKKKKKRKAKKKK